MFSRVAALDVVPLLSRIALALFLVPSGWTLLTAERTFRGDEYEMLESLGVVESPEVAAMAQWTTVPAAMARVTMAERVREQSATDAESAAPATTLPVEVVAEAVPSSREDAAATPAGVPTIAEPPVSGETEGVPARRLYEVAITFASAGWPQPVLLAWAAAIFSLLGGSMLLLGLVTRLWSLLAASLFGSLFWIESAPIVASAWMFGLDPQQSALVASQGAIFVLAFGLLLTGGGVVSLDRAIFRSGAAVDEEPAAS